VQYWRQKSDKKSAYVLTDISPNNLWRELEDAVWVQIELENLELFDPVAQEQYRKVLLQRSTQKHIDKSILDDIIGWRQKNCEARSCSWEPGDAGVAKQNRERRQDRLTGDGNNRPSDLPDERKEKNETCVSRFCYDTYNDARCVHV
jgi:hypothetical protein